MCKFCNLIFADSHSRIENVQFGFLVDLIGSFEKLRPYMVSCTCALEKTGKGSPLQHVPIAITMWYQDFPVSGCLCSQLPSASRCVHVCPSSRSRLQAATPVRRLPSPAAPWQRAGFHSNHSTCHTQTYCGTLWIQVGVVFKSHDYHMITFAVLLV